MVSTSRTAEAPKVPELVDASEGISLLQAQIDKARRLLDYRPIKLADHAKWNSETQMILISIFGSKSPNIQTIIYASGTTPVWMGMPDSVYENYMASSIENKIEMLNSCVVWLRKVSGMLKSENVEDEVV